MGSKEMRADRAIQLIVYQLEVQCDMIRNIRLLYNFLFINVINLFDIQSSFSDLSKLDSNTVR